MRITTSQIFQIGAAFIGLAIVVVPLVTTVDGHVVAVLGGAVATFWGTVGAILTTPSAQTKDVVAHIDDPGVKGPIAQAITSVRGVDGLQLNRNASPDMLALGASTSQENSKILPPKS